MELNPQRIATREKLILVGLYLSKYDSLALKHLGFDSFVEAFNAFGYAMSSKPASVKNYRDEFDPLFPNRRKGWHKRKVRSYCLKVFEEYKNLDLQSFTALVKSFVGYDESVWSQLQPKGKPGGGQSPGCGYDFRLESGPGENFLAVKVKGLKEVTGTLSLTPKEYEIATLLGDRFFLFVVRNFRESPSHAIFRNPLSGGLTFKRKERVMVQVSWLANV